VLNADHPITKGLPKKWMHPHEQLSHGQHGPAKNITVLSYAHSKDTGDNEVMDWVIPYGRGRVYVTMLGHLWKNKPNMAMRCIGFQTMLIRGCEWAATGKVSYPVPEDFPTATEMRLRAEEALGQITENINDGGTLFSVRSPSGMGRATIHQESWSNNVRLRLYLRGLEGLTISNGSVTFKTFALKDSGHGKLRRLLDDGQEKLVDKGDPYWTEIQAFDAKGKPFRGFPGEGGYFEMVLPQALFTTRPKSLNILWIDFYRR